MNTERKGSRIKLIQMVDDPNPIESGTEGTIKFEDDLGNIHIDWDNGRTLSLIDGVDEYEIISESKTFIKMFEEFKQDIDGVEEKVTLKYELSTDEGIPSLKSKIKRRTRNYAKEDKTVVKVINKDEQIPGTTINKFSKPLFSGDTRLLVIEFEPIHNSGDERERDVKTVEFIVSKLIGHKSEMIPSREDKVDLDIVRNRQNLQFNKIIRDLYVKVKDICDNETDSGDEIKIEFKKSVDVDASIDKDKTTHNKFIRSEDLEKYKKDLEEKERLREMGIEPDRKTVIKKMGNYGKPFNDVSIEGEDLGKKTLVRKDISDDAYIKIEQYESIATFRIDTGNYDVDTIIYDELLSEISKLKGLKLEEVGGRPGKWIKINKDDWRRGNGTFRLRPANIIDGKLESKNNNI